MPDIASIIAGNAANPWLYLPAAVLLGALHALEPGHAKSIMAAFIVATRGTAWQAVLLGLCAAIGHTIVVWALVLLAIWLGNDMIEKQAYPWLVLLSGVMIIAIAVRLLWVLARCATTMTMIMTIMLARRTGIMGTTTTTTDTAMPARRTSPHAMRGEKSAHWRSHGSALQAA